MLDSCVRSALWLPLLLVVGQNKGGSEGGTRLAKAREQQASVGEAHFAVCTQTRDPKFQPLQPQQLGLYCATQAEESCCIVCVLPGSAWLREAMYHMALWWIEIEGGGLRLGPRAFWFTGSLHCRGVV